MSAFYRPHLVPPVTIGQTVQNRTTAQATAQEAQQEAFTVSNLANAIQQVTPSLIVVGIATGASFAIGSWLVTRYLVGEGRRKR